MVYNNQSNFSYIWKIITKIVFSDKALLISSFFFFFFRLLLILQHQKEKLTDEKKVTKIEYNLHNTISAFELSFKKPQVEFDQIMFIIFIFYSATF